MKRIIYYISLVAVALLTGCADEAATDSKQPLPDGMGRLRVTITTPEKAVPATRAVRQPNAWEDPDHEWEQLQTLRIFICKAANNEVVQIISGAKADFTEQAHEGTSPTTTDSENSTHKWHIYTSDPLPAGSYHIFATANYADGYAVGSAINPEATAKFTAFNGYSETNIPMTGKLMNADGTLKPVGVSNGVETDAGTLALWRVVGKLSFEFANETSEQVQILGIEVEPINQASTTGSGIYLFSKDNLASEANLAPLFPSGATKTVAATWALNAIPSHSAAAAVTMGGVFASTSLAWGSKLSATGEATTYDNAYKLQKFKTTENISSKDNDAVITLKVTPATGMSFTPKSLSLKACKVGTDGGKFDVEAGGTTVAAEVTPPRYNGAGGNHEPPFFKEYSYAINGTATTAEYTVKIYLYNLNDEKEYAFRDIVLSGEVTNNSGAAMQEHISLPTGALTDVGPVSYAPATALTLGANGSSNATGSLFFYVNETDATYTAVNNQISIRLLIARQKPGNNGQWYDDELRYGMTTPYTEGTTGGNGFNVIRRNDWIHIPIHLTDWQFRVEPLAFVPIAGYPAATLSSDALTTTFSTGGPIILQPFAQKSNDGTWRDFTDPEVVFVSLTWTNSDGTNVAGTGKIFETAPAYDATTGRIVGILNNNLATGTYKTTITVNVKLGTAPAQYEHAFTFNVVLQK